MKKRGNITKIVHQFKVKKEMPTTVKSKQRCPLCKGEGFIIGFGYSDTTRATARELFAKGIPLREIGKKIGVNHPQKVKSLIMSKRL